MSTQLEQVFSQNHAGLKAHPEQAVATFAVSSRGLDGLHRSVSIRDFSIEVDEPPVLGGTDRAPNPVEYALAALATCQEITYRLHAAALGIPLNEVRVELKGDIDLRGFFAVEPGVRPGFSAISGTVHFDSTASEADLRHLKEIVDAHCPVLDLFRNATPVQLDVATLSHADRAFKLVA